MATTKPSFLTGISCKYDQDALSNIDYFWDEVCGTYSIRDDAKSELENHEENKRKIACVLAQRKCRRITFSSQITIDKTGKDSDSMQEKIEDLLSLYPSPSEIFDEALLNLSYFVTHPSVNITITQNESWYVYAYNLASALWMLQQLEKLDYIEFKEKFLNEILFSITAKGWFKISEINKNINKDSNQAFIAMWFDDSMSSYYGSIKAAIEQNNNEYLRIDALQHNNKICDEIIAEIRRSKYLIADFTGNRGGVYYEAGFAFGLGIPVIWIVHQDHLEKIHFDTRQYNHIVYDSPENLQKQLCDRIKATIV